MSTESNVENKGDTEIRKHLTSDEFHETFYETEQGKKILQQVDTPFEMTEKNKKLLTEDVKKWFGNRYRNSNMDSLKLLIYRYVIALNHLPDWFGRAPCVR